MYHSLVDAGRFLEKMEETPIEDSKVVGETPITKCSESVEESAFELQRSEHKYEDIIAEVSSLSVQIPSGSHEQG